MFRATLEIKNTPLAINSGTGTIKAFAKRNAARLGRPWEGVKVYGSVGNAKEHQSYSCRFNLSCQLEAFLESAMYADRNEPLPAYFSSLGVLVVPLSELKKTLETSDE